MKVKVTNILRSVEKMKEQKGIELRKNSCWNAKVKWENITGCC
jgi:hypothetical protein